MSERWSDPFAAKVRTDAHVRDDVVPRPHGAVEGAPYPTRSAARPGADATSEADLDPAVLVLASARDVQTRQQNRHLLDTTTEPIECEVEAPLQLLFKAAR